VLGDLGGCHLRTPSPDRHLRKPIVLTLSEVRSIPAIITTVPPAADFGKLIEDTLEAHESETADDTRLRRIASVTQRKFLRNDTSVQAPVHCECVLVHYFNDPTVASDEIPPINFLGVSKLSCIACARFIEASNKYRNRKFYTRGCRGKLYFPWALPPSGQRIASAFKRARLATLSNCWSGEEPQDLEEIAIALTPRPTRRTPPARARLMRPT